MNNLTHNKKLTLTKFPYVPGGRGHSIFEFVSLSGHGLHFLSIGSPKETSEVNMEIAHTSTICTKTKSKKHMFHLS